MWNRQNRTLLNRSVIAHQIQIDQSIGATKHIEPNDNPRAGEPSVIWFALTQQGGASIPLADCDCQLTVYAQDQTEPFVTPELTPIAAEGYDGIPSATVTFPEVGAYRLRLQGQPVSEQDFAAFELEFDVLVAQAARSPASTDVAESDTQIDAGPASSDVAITETPTETSTETLSATATTTEVGPNSGLPSSGVLGAVVVLVLLGVGAGAWFIRKRSQLK
ncbi:MAG: hypothetical protein AAGF24_02935 [Cyanobacteria bacterium P01_H01_bin.121]